MSIVDKKSMEGSVFTGSRRKKKVVRKKRGPNRVNQARSAINTVRKVKRQISRASELM